MHIIEDISRILLACLLLAGCAKTDVSVPEFNQDGDRFDVSVRVASLTKSTSDAAETSISSIQLFAFDSAGNRDNYVTGNASAVANVPRGQHRFWVVANSPSLSHCLTLSSFTAAVSNLTENSLSSLVMTGYADLNVTGNAALDVTVKRLVSKIKVERITNGFSASYLSGRTLTLNAIYLTNICGRTTMEGVTQNGLWYNMMGYDASGTPASVSALTRDSIGSAVSSEYSTEHVFYCYPNSTATDHRGGAWEPRFTRLVIDATVSGVADHCYYAIDIPSIGRNRVYTFNNITLVRLGADSEEGTADNTALHFNVTVTSWNNENCVLYMGSSLDVSGWGTTDTGEDF